MQCNSCHPLCCSADLITTLVANSAWNLRMSCSQSQTEGKLCSSPVLPPSTVYTLQSVCPTLHSTLLCPHYIKLVEVQSAIHTPIHMYVCTIQTPVATVQTLVCVHICTYVADDDQPESLDHHLDRYHHWKGWRRKEEEKGGRVRGTGN